MNQEEIRKQFESWINNTSRRAGVHFQRDINGKYKDNRVASKWSAWQAALSSKQEQENKQKILIDAITEVLRVLETDNETIVDVLWTTRNDNETLWEHCASALEQVTGIEYKPQEQFALDLKQEHIESTQDNEGWIDLSLVDFSFGETPEDPSTRVDVKFADGSFDYGTKCGAYRWNQIGSDNDIIAYRIAKESQ